MAWYELAEDDRLLQGDILPQCPLYLPVVADDGSMAISKRQATVVVMTQSCDLENDKNIQHVVVCSVNSIARFVMTDPGLRKKAQEAAQLQHVPWPSAEEADAEDRVWNVIRASTALRKEVVEFEKGRRPGYVLLHPREIPPTMPLSIVSFRYVFMQPIRTLVEHARASHHVSISHRPTVNIFPNRLGIIS